MVSVLKPEFWQGKRVFVTGHTGFKGGWLCLWLHSMGAKVYGYSLPPSTTPNLFEVADIGAVCQQSIFSNICDLDRLISAINQADPDVLFHMAAQPLVRYSYRNPIETFATNVMGTANVLEASRGAKKLRSILVITTDKCYENIGYEHSYSESEPLGGDDPYSCSKACAELVSAAYYKSFYSNSDSHCFIATARAGNVIGGGDWSEDRLLPDAFRSLENAQPLHIRYPRAIRPWQHVLEPISGYLLLGQNLYECGSNFVGAWNFGPNPSDEKSVETILDMLEQAWGASIPRILDLGTHLHEASFLKLDCTKANEILNWHPRWDLNIALHKLSEWQHAFYGGENMQKFSINQINEYGYQKN